MSYAALEPLPSGFCYIPNFLSAVEEHELVDVVRSMTFASIHMHGVVAKRRTAHFGWLYGYESWNITPGPPVPTALLPLRERAARLIHVAPSALEEVLVTDYPPGAGIGWHRDAPMFGPSVVGISLLGPARFRFQRRTPAGRHIAEAHLEPRSVYVLSGEARRLWQHSIPAGGTQRYSITFRTLARADKGAQRPVRGRLSSRVGDPPHQSDMRSRH